MTRLRCACHASFTPQGELVEGVMRVICHRCRRVIVVARYEQTTVSVTVTREQAPTLRTVLDVVRWSHAHTHGAECA